MSIRSLLTQIEAMAPIREQLETDIETLADRLPGYIFTLPGINPISAVSLFGETDPIETLPSGAQLVAFAGLDTTVFQTGQYEAPRWRITKRGSPFLRHLEHGPSGLLPGSRPAGLLAPLPRQGPAPPGRRHRHGRQALPCRLVDPE